MKRTKRGLSAYENPLPIPSKISGKKLGEAYIGLDPSVEMSSVSFNTNFVERRTGDLKDFIVLANDPSVCAWGFAVLDGKGIILETGCIKTAGGGKKMRIRKGDDTVRRISEINQRLLQMIKKHHVTYLISELPHGSQNASAAVMQGTVSGIGQTIADCLAIGIEWYSEGDSKKCLLGKISAEKKETIQAISKLYDWKPSGTKYIDEAVADALSIHYVASKQSSILKMFNL